MHVCCVMQAGSGEASCGYGSKEAAATQIRWALHTGQLQLAPAAAELLQGLASLPLQPTGWEPEELGWALDERQHEGRSGSATFDYMLEPQRFAQGGFGEVWRAELRTDHGGAYLSEALDGTAAHAYAEVIVSG